MSGLLSIAAASAVVPVGAQALTVQGVSLQQLAGLMLRFPELRKVLLGGGFDAGAMMLQAPQAIAAIIAAGCGEQGDDAEAAASRLPLDAQAQCIAEILRMTLPNGVAPLIAHLSVLGALLGLKEAITALPASAPVTNSRKRSTR